MARLPAGWWLAPALLAVLAYLPSLGFQLVWDDLVWAQHPPYRDPDLWLSSVWQPFIMSPNYFRPLALLTLVAELRSGAPAWVSHAVNVMVHATNTALVTLLVLSLSGEDRKAALAGGALYALHPALVEAVGFVSSRFDLLVTLFLLLALWADHRIQAPWRRAAALGIAFLLAAGCKETAAAFALVLPLWHLATGRSLRSQWRSYASVGAAGLAYLALRATALGHLLTDTPQGRIDVGTPLQHLLLVARTLAGYLALMVWPFGRLAPLHVETLPVPEGSPLAWSSLALVVAGGVLAVAYLRRPGAGQRSLAALLLAAVAALLPVIHIRPLQLGDSLIAERYLAFPLALAVLASSGPLRLALANTARVAAVVGVLAACLATLELTLPHWRSQEALWSWAMERAPGSATPPTNLSLVHIESQRYASGVELARRATEIDPGHANAWVQLGLGSFHLERYGEAETAFRRALLIAPENPLAWNNLAAVLREQGRLREAEELLVEHALPLAPNLGLIHLNLAVIQLRGGRFGEAERTARNAWPLLPPALQPQALMIVEMAQRGER